MLFWSLRWTVISLFIASANPISCAGSSPARIACALSRFPPTREGSIVAAEIAMTCPMVPQILLSIGSFGFGSMHTRIFGSYSSILLMASISILVAHTGDFDSAHSVPSLASHRTIMSVPSSFAISMERYALHIAYSRSSFDVLMNPPSCVCGSIQSLGATNSAFKLYLSSVFFSSRAFSLISSSV